MKNFLLFATGISFCIFISCQQTSFHKPFVKLSSLELSEERCLWYPSVMTLLAVFFKR